MKSFLSLVLLGASFVASAQSFTSFTVIKGGFIVHGLSGDGNTLVGEVNGAAATWNPFHGTKLLLGGAGAWGTDASFDGSVIIGRNATDTYLWRPGKQDSYQNCIPGGVSNSGQQICMYNVGQQAVEWYNFATRDYQARGAVAGRTGISGDGTAVFYRGSYFGYPENEEWRPPRGLNAISEKDDYISSVDNDGWLQTGNRFFAGANNTVETHWIYNNMDLGNLGTFPSRTQIDTFVTDSGTAGATFDKIYQQATKAVTPFSDFLAVSKINPGMTDMRIVDMSFDGLTYAGTGYIGSTLYSWRAKLNPYGKSDVYQVVPNQTLSVSSPGVRANDPYQFDGTIALEQQAQHGTVNLQEYGGFTYTPQANYTGRDTFTYRYTQGINISDPVTVVLKVGVPASLTLGAPTVAGGSKVSARVILNYVAFSPVEVAVKASKPGLVSMPSSVTVPAGAKSTTFLITTTSPATTTTTTISATLNEVSVSASLTVAGPSPKTLVLNPAEIRGGASTSGHVTLWKAAPAGGLEVKFSSSNTAVATVPGGYTVPQGAQTFDFPISTVQVPAATTVTIGVSGNGSSASATLTVRTPTMVSMSLSNTTVPSGGTLRMTINMDAVPSTYGYKINLSDGGAFKILNSQTAHVPFHAPTTTETETIVASVTGEDGKVLSKSIQVTPTVLTGVSVRAPKIVSGSMTYVEGVYDGVPDSSANLTLSSSNTAAVTVQSSVPANQTAAIKANGVDAETVVTITGTYKGKSKSATVTVSPGLLKDLVLNPTSVKGGFNSIGTVSITGPAGPSGTKVTLSNSNTAYATVPASVIVPAGYKSVQFTIVTKAVTQNRTVTIGATEGGVNVLKTLTITP